MSKQTGHRRAGTRAKAAKVAPAKTPATEVDPSNASSDKKAGVNKSDSSDDEPLIKIAKKAPKVAKTLDFVPPRKSADKKRRDSTSGDSSDDEPLSKLTEKLNSRPQRELHIMPSKGANTPTRPRKERSAKMNIVKYEETSSDSSDDKPLAQIKQKMTKTNKAQRTTAKRQKVKRKEESLKAKKLVTDINSSNTSTNASDKKAGGNKSDSSDDEPLIKIAKKAPKVAKKLSFVLPKRSADTKRRESTSGDSSDDEPLSEVAKKLNSKPQRELHIVLTKGATSPIRPRKERTAKMNIVKYDEMSSDSSDGRPLAEIKKKMITTDKAQRTIAKRKVKCKEESLKDSSSDDDVPLANLAAKKKPASESAKTALRVSTPRKKQGPDSDSSDDEPLSHIIKKKRAENRLRTTKKETTMFKKAAHTCISDQGSFNKPLNEAVHHPQVTKAVKIILKRCNLDFNKNKPCID